MIRSNGIISVSVNEKTGRFSVRHPEATEYVVENAAFSVNGMPSTEAESMRVFCLPFSDGLGSGEETRIQGSMRDGQEILLAIRQYQGKSFVTLRCGLVNRAPRPVQVREMRPVDASAKDALLRVGPDVSRGHRLLTGEGGFSFARLLDGVTGETLNVMTVLCLDAPFSRAMVLGQLTSYEFQTRVETWARPDRRDGFAAAVTQFDATGKRVDPGTEFWGDWLYLDPARGDPHCALEDYAARMARAMRVKLNNYNDYISVCLWYVFAFSCGDRSANTSRGAVQEAMDMNASGITRYAPALIRLVPDEYVNPNEQLWWDESHWQRYNHLTPPYETLEKWIGALHAVGAEGGLYMQPTFRSDDYCAEYPGHMLFDRAEHEADYTDPDFIRHMRAVYARVRGAGVKAMFYDYTMLTRGSIREDINSLLQPGGFADPYATNVSAYRSIFRLAKESAGEALMITENTWNYSGQELSTGVIDAQRSRMDNVGMNRETIRSGARQWYRNQVTKLVDPDVKNFTVSDRDIRRKEVSLMGLLFGKTMLGSSISRYGAEEIYDIGRILPMPLLGRSARPLDLFLLPPEEDTEKLDLPLPDGGHIAALVNHTQKSKTLSLSLGGAHAFGGMALCEDARYDIWDFWNECYVGRLSGAEELTQTLRKNECRVLAVRACRDTLYILSTSRHLLQGLIETRLLEAGRDSLRFSCALVAGEEMRVIVACPKNGWELEDVSVLTQGVTCSAEKDPFDPFVRCRLYSEAAAEAMVVLRLRKAEPFAPPAPRPVTGLLAETDPRAGSVTLRWAPQAGMRFAVYKDGALAERTLEDHWTDCSILENERADYAVRAENARGEAGEAARARVQTGAFVPAVYHGLGGANGRYGAQGHVFFNQYGPGRDEDRRPAWVSEITVENRRDHRFPVKPDDRRALCGENGEKALGAVCDDHELRLRLRFGDGAAHRVTLYCVDFNRGGRTMDLSVEQDGSPLIESVNIPELGEGVHLSFVAAGDVRVRLTNHAVNALVNALYFD